MSSIWPVSQSEPWAAEKKVCSVEFRWNVPHVLVSPFSLRCPDLIQIFLNWGKLFIRV